MNATEAVVEGRMEPVGKTDAKPQTFLTGQYLYDTFMAPSEGERTKLQIVRSWVDDQRADVVTVGNALDAMVKRGAELDAQAWKGPKNEKGTPVDDKGKKVRGVKEQSAMNARTIIQNAYGALKFARAELEANGYVEGETGYLTMRVIGKKALDDKRIVWTGENQKTEADRQAARLRKEQKEEIAALQDVQKTFPRAPDETLAQWQARTLGLAESAMKQAREEAEAEIIAKVMADLYAKHGQSRVIDLAFAILEKEGIDLNPAEPTEQQALDAMANVSEEEAAH